MFTTMRVVPTVVWFAVAAVTLNCKGNDPASVKDTKPTPVPAIRTQPDPSQTKTPAAVAKPIVVAAAKPDTISHASEYSNDGTKVGTTEVFDGAAQRKKNRARLAADTSDVHLLQGGNALELGKRICQDVVPTVAVTTPILLKPNMGGFDWFRNPKDNHGDNGVTGRTTDPEFVRGVIQCLKARGFSKITVADGFTGKASDWNTLIKVSGYAAMTAEEKVPLVAMDDDGVFDVQGEKPGKPVAISGMEKTSVPTLLMPRLLAWHLQHGLYISLPKMKTHRYAVFSMGIKAQQGTVFYSNAAPAFHQRGRSHIEIGKALKLVKAKAPDARTSYVTSLETFAQRMADVLEVEAPDVVLAEGAPAMSGDGFGQLFPSAEMVAVGGTNVIAVDRIGAEFLGLWNNSALATELGGHRTSPLLEVAAKQMKVDIEAPHVVGDGAVLLRRPRPYHLIGMAGFVVRGSGDGSFLQTLGAADPGMANASNSKELPALHAKKVATAAAPNIDGNDDDIWDSAAALPWNTDWSGESTTIGTTVRALWHPGDGATRATLYMRWELDDADIAAGNTDQSRPVDQERVDLYTEDCIEMFFTPNPSEPSKYFEIELGPYGHFFDLAIDRNARGAARSDATWSSGVRIGTSRDIKRGRVVIEAAFTSTDMTSVLSVGASLPLGLYRMEGKKPRRYLAAYPTRTPKPNFHVPEAFGRLVID
jgi:uncharacterized protein (DUF362 family)